MDEFEFKREPTSQTVTKANSEQVEIEALQTGIAPQESLERSNENARAEGEAEGFWQEVRAKVISWRSMQPSMRLITAVGIAQLLAAGLVIALHGVPSPQMSLGLQSGHAVHIAVPYFWLSVIFTCIAISFLMTGALLLRWPVRLLALILFSAFTLLPGVLYPYAAIRVALVIALWLWAWVIALGHSAAPEAPARPTPPQRLAAWARHAPLPALTLGILLLIEVTLYLVLLATTGWTRDSNLIFQLSFQAESQILAFVLIPVLILAGSDFAELGELIGSGIANATRIKSAQRGVWLTLGLTALVAIIVALTTKPNIPGNINDTLLAYIGEFAVATAMVCALVALLRWSDAIHWPAARLRALTLLAAALIYFVISALASIAIIAQNNQIVRVTLTDFQVYQTPPATSPAFSLPYPAGWKPALASNNNATQLTISGLNQQYVGYVFVLALAQPDATSANASQALKAFLLNIAGSSRTLKVNSTGNDGAWHTQRFTLNASTSNVDTLTGEGWSQARDGHIWLIVGVTPHVNAQVLLPAFASMAHEWRPDLTAKAPQTHETDLAAITARSSAIYLGLLPLLLGPALGFLLMRFGGRWSPTLRVTGLFFAASGLLFGATALPSILQIFGAPNAFAWFLSLPSSAMQQVVAIATLALVGYVVLRRRDDTTWVELIRLALALNIGLLFIVRMLNLYTVAIGVSKTSLAHPLSWEEGAIVLIALGWDLVMSGEAFTNRDDKSFPRHTRLLLYMGYITLTATLVMYFSTQSYTFAPGAHEALFESEPWPQLGLRILGLPMVIVTFALGMVAWLRRRAQASEAPANIAAGTSVEQVDNERHD